MTTAAKLEIAIAECPTASLSANREVKMGSSTDLIIAAQNDYQFETEDAAGKITAGSLELAVSALKMTFGDDVSGWIVTENGDRNAIGRSGVQN